MERAYPHYAVEREVRFLAYRLDVIARWPESTRKQAAREAITRRLASIARSTLEGPDGAELLLKTCRLLDTVFSDVAGDPAATPRAA